MNTEIKRGPGRPRTQSPAGMSPFERTREEADMSGSRDPNEAVKASRTRIPLGSGQQTWFMNYQFDRDNYHYYVFHESATRGGVIAAALNAAYEHCQLDGVNITRPSGNGTDYLMRLPMEYHLEDLERQEQRAKAMEKAQNTLKGDGNVQEYGIDPKSGKPFFEGEAIAKQTVSDNPYA